MHQQDFSHDIISLVGNVISDFRGIISIIGNIISNLRGIISITANSM